MKLNKVIISGGGTGGHIFPALAIADQIKERNPAAAILFVGAEGKMEMEKVPQAGYEIVGLPIVGLQRKLTLKNLMLPFKLVHSSIKAFRILRRFKPQLVIGVGGYASGPTLQIAQILGIPTLLQEQNSFAGKTNQLLAKKAKAICVAYPNMHKFFPADKIYLTGNPLRANLHLAAPDLKLEAAAFFGLDINKPTLFVMGGSLGAKTLNVALRAAIASLTSADVQVIWQCGKSYEQELSTFEQQLPSSIKVFPFIQRMDYAYTLADVVVSRAGALSVSELALIGKPVIFVPSPNVAEDHQTQNALSLVERGAALMVRDAATQKELLPTVLALFKDQQRREELTLALRQLALPNASQAIVDICQKITQP
ncbi:MAG: undecaprenyldiphospho-muramoylpentapeptide beta-N-acetylglucosaminyltransferase [Sphingomonadales bacterium]|nr:undecaprenyldiphospho-muramoylpentapeptide beta-N-acetylglucosaminyltransferase [Sphingomonadales bacterium]